MQLANWASFGRQSLKTLSTNENCLLWQTEDFFLSRSMQAPSSFSECLCVASVQNTLLPFRLWCSVIGSCGIIGFAAVVKGVQGILHDWMHPIY